jgi:hypothetical protein
MAKTKKDQVYLNVINELVKERDKWEYRYKYPLPKGWMYADEHPRIGEVVLLFPNIFKT